MKREKRAPTKKEWTEITSSRPVVRRIRQPDKADCPGPNEAGAVRTGDKAKSFDSDLTNSRDFTTNDKRESRGGA